MHRTTEIINSSYRWQSEHQRTNFLASEEWTSFMSSTTLHYFFLKFQAIFLSENNMFLGITGKTMTTEAFLSTPECFRHIRIAMPLEHDWYRYCFDTKVYTKHNLQNVLAPACQHSQNGRLVRVDPAHLHSDTAVTTHREGPADLSRSHGSRRRQRTLCSSPGVRSQAFLFHPDKFPNCFRLCIATENRA